MGEEKVGEEATLSFQAYAKPLKASSRVKEMAGYDLASIG